MFLNGNIPTTGKLLLGTYLELTALKVILID